MRGIGIGPLHFDFCRRSYLHDSTASIHSRASVDCSAVLLTCQMAELLDFRTKNSHNWLNVSLFIRKFWHQVDNNHGQTSGIWVIWIQYRENNSFDSDLKWSSIILSQKNSLSSSKWSKMLISSGFGPGVFLQWSRLKVCRTDGVAIFHGAVEESRAELETGRNKKIPWEERTKMSPEWWCNCAQIFLNNSLAIIVVFLSKPTLLRWSAHIV